MSQELLQAEVRLYFTGRSDWDTEFFKATCPSDIYHKASVIAAKRHAVHFNCSLATPEERPYAVKKLRGLSANPKDQVAAIEAHLGVDREEA